MVLPLQVLLWQTCTWLGLSRYISVICQWCRAGVEKGFFDERRLEIVSRPRSSVAHVPCHPWGMEREFMGANSNQL